MALVAGLLLGACGNDANFYITQHWDSWQERLDPLLEAGCLLVFHFF